MATDYTVKGVTALIAPVSLQWSRITIGEDHERVPIYAGTEEIIMQFPASSPTFARQWLDAASSGSGNFTVLDRNKMGFTDLSGVNLIITSYPTITDVNAGPFSAKIIGVLPT